MIVAESAIETAPKRKPASQPIAIPRDQTGHLYNEILKIIGFCPQYNELFVKLAEHNLTLKGKVKLNEQELNQLFDILKIEHEFTKPAAPQPVFDPFIPPKNAPLVDLYENGPEIQPESTLNIDLSEYRATDEHVRPKNIPMFDLSEFGETEPVQPQPTKPEPTKPAATSTLQIDTNSPEFQALHAETTKLYREFMENTPIKEISYQNSGFTALFPYKERNIIKKSHKKKK
jgi:hypothetical protein